eukprot:3901455-Ditylum_brightwellii.AAC.1
MVDPACGLMQHHKVCKSQAVSDKKEEEEEDGMHISDADESENGTAATKGSEMVELKEEGEEGGEEVKHPVKKLFSKDNHGPPKKDRKDHDHHHC